MLNAFIPMKTLSQVCNFWRDCAEGEDEATCPDFYDFESCDTVGM
jgi:hypothetical protein